LFEYVLFGFSMFRLTKRRDEDRRVFGHVCHEVPVADGVRPETRWAVGHKRGIGDGEGDGVKGNCVMGVGFGRGILGVVGVRSV
jgi:hypothetical protein